MKKIMILGASSLQVPIIQKAKEMGIYVIVVTPNLSEPGVRYADETAQINLKNEDQVLEKARALGIDGITTDQTDIAVRSVAYVAENLGLPGIGYENALLFTDKHRMRERCKQLSIRTLRYKLTHTYEEAEIFFDELGQDVVLKPVDNQGSRGVCRVTTKKELAAKYPEAFSYQRGGGVLIEEYVTGREFVVEGITYNHEFQNLIIGDTYYFDIPDVFSATQRVFPTNADDNLYARVAEMNRKIITGFGLKQGISHSEFIMHGDDVILIETAARGGGVFISSDLISLSTGLCAEEFLIRIALGELNTPPMVKQNLCACCYVAFYLPAGTVSRIDGIQETLALPYVHRNTLEQIQPGVVTKPFTDKTARYFLVLEAKDRTELTERVNRVKALLDHIRVTTEDGVKGPIWESVN